MILMLLFLFNLLFFCKDTDFVYFLIYIALLHFHIPHQLTDSLHHFSILDLHTFTDGRRTGYFYCTQFATRISQTTDGTYIHFLNMVTIKI